MQEQNALIVQKSALTVLTSTSVSDARKGSTCSQAHAENFALLALSPLMDNVLLVAIDVTSAKEVLTAASLVTEDSFISKGIALKNVLREPITEIKAAWLAQLVVSLVKVIPTNALLVPLDNPSTITIASPSAQLRLLMEFVLMFVLMVSSSREINVTNVTATARLAQVQLMHALVVLLDSLAIKELVLKIVHLELWQEVPLVLLAIDLANLVLDLSLIVKPVQQVMFVWDLHALRNVETAFT